MTRLTHGMCVGLFLRVRGRKYGERFGDSHNCGKSCRRRFCRRAGARGGAQALRPQKSLSRRRVFRRVPRADAPSRLGGCAHFRRVHQPPVPLKAQTLLVSAVATSIDAAAVGVSLAMAEMNTESIILSVVSVFVVTAAAAVTGIVGGCSLGRRFGRPAQIAGGIVLIAIGLNILIG